MCRKFVKINLLLIKGDYTYDTLQSAIDIAGGDRVNGVNSMPTIQTSYVGMPQEDADSFVEALASLGIFEYTKFWQGCVDALLVHHERGEMIAWPPAFALQGREPEYIQIKLQLAHRFLLEQERLKNIKEGFKLRKRNKIQ